MCVFLFAYRFLRLLYSSLFYSLCCYFFFFSCFILYCCFLFLNRRKYVVEPCTISCNLFQCFFPFFFFFLLCFLLICNQSNMIMNKKELNLIDKRKKIKRKRTRRWRNRLKLTRINNNNNRKQIPYLFFSFLYKGFKTWCIFGC